MKKFILFTLFVFLSGFTSLSQAALMNVASIEIATPAGGSSGKLSISELIASELGSGIDLASVAQGAVATGPTKGKWKGKKKGWQNQAAFAIDDKVSKKQQYFFPKNKKSSDKLVIDLASVSNIESIFVKGKLAKKKNFLSMSFLDVQGNLIYKIDNLKKTVGKTTYVLPDLAGVPVPPVANVPVPGAFWLFASGLLGLVAVKRPRGSVTGAVFFRRMLARLG